MKRQPQGTPIGGQFAQDRKPEGGELSVDVTPWVEDEYDETLDHAADAASNLTGAQLAKFTQNDEPDQDAGFYRCGSCGDTAQEGSSSTCTNCSSEMEWVDHEQLPSVDGGAAANLELAERLNTVHGMWQDFDDGEQLSKDDFEIIYKALDDTTKALNGDDSDPASSNATNKELADKIDNVHHLVLNFDRDSTPLSRDDFDYVYEALEEAREVLGAGGPHGSGVPQYDKQRMIDIIRNEFSIPGREPTELFPVGDGFELLANSSIEIDESNRHPDDTAWDADLEINGILLRVINEGQGGPNRYVAKKVPAEDQEAFVRSCNEAVLRGFPGLEGPHALDTFCTLVQVIEENS